MFLQIRMWQRDSRDRTVLQPTPAAAIDVSEYFYLYFIFFCIQQYGYWKHDACVITCLRLDSKLILCECLSYIGLADVTYSCLC